MRSQALLHIGGYHADTSKPACAMLAKFRIVSPCGIFIGQNRELRDMCEDLTLGPRKNKTGHFE